jgi:hypothetical protein
MMKHWFERAVEDELQKVIDRIRAKGTGRSQRRLAT